MRDPAGTAPPRQALPVGALRSVLDDDLLNVGWWSPDATGTTLGAAQEELLSHLAALLPPPPATVLLVEPGLGLAAASLAERGYEVTAMLPHAGTAEVAASRHRHPRVSFRAGTILDPEIGDRPDSGYNAVVIVGSPVAGAAPGRLFARLREVLADGGVAVIAGDVSAGDGLGASPPSPDDLTVAAAEHGFRPAGREDATSRVAPACAELIARLAAAERRAVEGGAPVGEVGVLRAEREAWERRRDAYASGVLAWEIRAVRRDPYLMRTYRAGDEIEIVRMFREVFGVERSIEHWRWKFGECPYGTHCIAETTSAAGELLAHFGGYPVPFYTSAGGGREFLAHQVGDTMTRPAIRQAGLGRHGILARISSYYFARFRGDIPFVYGFNTGHIRKLGERYLGYVYIDQVGYRVRDLAAGPIGAPAPWRRRLLGYAFSELTAADPELDRLFERVKDEYGLLVRRDAVYVGWRYLRCPDRVHRVFAIRRWGRLVGWCAFSRRGADLVWGDALVEPAHAPAAAWLLRWVVEGPFHGVERIWGWFAPHPEWWSATVAAAGFVGAVEPNELTPCFVFFGRSASQREMAERWYYTYGDSDLF